MQRYFITGIGTDVGKTVAAAAVTEALKADYWKPVQCGLEGGTDNERVRALISNSQSVFHAESYLLKEPASPHFAAALENNTIQLEMIAPPETENTLVIEGAGGILVPLNNKQYVIEIANHLDAEVILVCRNYLGCINHSLLSIEYLLSNGYNIKGLILNGNFEKAVKHAICSFAEIPVIAELPEVKEISKESILNMSTQVKTELFLDAATGE